MTLYNTLHSFAHVRTVFCMKKVTIQDIAADMGLSRNTIAKALNGGAVSEATRMAIVKRAWQMGYNKIDPALLEKIKSHPKTAGTGTILVLLNQQKSVFWSRILAGISDSVNLQGYRMQLHIVDEEQVTGKEILDVLAEDVKGIIFLCILPIDCVREIAGAGIPLTFLNTPVYSEEYIALGDVINTESFYAMNRITSYIIEKRGCRKLSFIGYAEGSRVVQGRFLGYMNACKMHNIEIVPQLQFTKPTGNTYFGYSHVERIVNSMNELPDAFVCENDDVAEFVATALLQKDPRLVKETVITGFNNTIDEDFFKKDIVTVSVRTEELGRRLVRSIIDRVENPEQDLSFITIATYPQFE